MIKYNKQGYLSQFVSEMFDFLQLDSARNALQYELTSFVTIATNRVPDLHDINGFSDLFKHSILIFANGASFA